MESKEYDTKVDIEKIDYEIKDEYGCIYSPDGKRLLIGNGDITSYTIKEGAEIICDNAFNGWRSSLQSIVIPESVTKIGANAFPSGIEITSLSGRFVVKEDLLIDIVEKRLIQCLQDKEHVVIPQMATSIENKAFWECRFLQSVVIPDSVTKIGHSPFPTEIKVTSHSKRFVVENDLLIDIVEKRLIQCLQDKEHVVIPDSVTIIGDSAFKKCISLQSIVIPDSVTTIGEDAFSFCYSLQSIVIPDSVTTIGEDAFDDYCYLESIDIPESAPSISLRTLSNYKSLQSMITSEKISETEESTPEGCWVLRSIIVPEGKKEYFESLLDEEYHELLKEE